MANHKSAVKSHEKSVVKRDKNIALLSRIKTFIKKVETAITAKDNNSAQEHLRVAESELMKGVKKKVLKHNTASRKVSRLTKKVKSLSVPA